MSALQCPKCELKFGLRSELDYHCREDHATFQHEYPIGWTHEDAAHQPPPLWAPVEGDRP